ncbi:MAG: hypothetical protein AAB340_03195 [Patescibacteria group bacterium]
MSKSKSSELVRGAGQRNTYVVPVNYGLSHKKQIEAGRFDWITSYDGKLIRKNPTEHLVPVGSGQVEQRMTLVHLNGKAKTEKVLAEMEKLTLRPTMSTETLAFLAAHPDVQRKFQVIGLGSIWVGSYAVRHVLYAYGGSCGRNLILYWYADEWPDRCCFPAVPKSWLSASNNQSLVS